MIYLRNMSLIYLLETFRSSYRRWSTKRLFIKYAANYSTSFFIKKNIWQQKQHWMNKTLKFFVVNYISLSLFKVGSNKRKCLIKKRYLFILNKVSHLVSQFVLMYIMCIYLTLDQILPGRLRQNIYMSYLLKCIN